MVFFIELVGFISLLLVVLVLVPAMLVSLVRLMRPGCTDVRFPLRLLWLLTALNGLLELTVMVGGVVHYWGNRTCWECGPLREWTGLVLLIPLLVGMLVTWRTHKTEIASLIWVSVWIMGMVALKGYRLVVTLDSFGQ